MNSVLPLLIIAVLYIVLVRVVLPKMGVHG